MGIESTAIIGGIIASAGLFLKYATLPVLMAYELGRAVERLRNGRQTPAR
jgi:hypothetical protein